jgi:hypothetical protein
LTGDEDSRYRVISELVAERALLPVTQHDEVSASARAQRSTIGEPEQTRRLAGCGSIAEQAG